MLNAEQIAGDRPPPPTRAATHAWTVPTVSTDNVVLSHRYAACPRPL